jgi:hypothetical protein
MGTLACVLSQQQIRHDLTKDLHVFGSYVTTGHLPRTHPFVVDMRMSDPKHFDTILPFLQPLGVPHRIDLTIADIEAMHTVAGQDVDFLHPTSNVHTRSRGPLDVAHSLSLVSDPSPSDSGESIDRRVENGTTRMLVEI